MRSSLYHEIKLIRKNIRWCGFVVNEKTTVKTDLVKQRGRRFVLKFDPPGYPELATAPDVLVSKFFYALGYHVPENYIVYFTADQLKLKDGVMLRTLAEMRGR